ncbi:MAG: c-type cytochrome [Candidatus Acidiferrum sp.]
MRLLLRVCFCLTLFAFPAFLEAQTKGADEYHAHCARCHADDGSGKGHATRIKMQDLRSKEVQALTDQELFETIARGTKHKEYPHAFLYTGMTKEQIESVVAFIRGLKDSSKQGKTP